MFINWGTTAEGIALAKQRGASKGRKRTLSPECGRVGTEGRWWYPENCPRRRLWNQQGVGVRVPAPGKAFL